MMAGRRVVSRAQWGRTRVVGRRLAVGGKPGGFAPVVQRGPRGDGRANVASMGHTCCRVPRSDVRDLCAVTVPHIYGNYYHAIRIRCFSTLRYMRIADLSRFSGMFSELSIGDEMRERISVYVWISMRCATKILLLVNHRGDILRRVA